MLAVYVKNKEMVEFLIRKNANVNASDNSKRTALMLAVKDESSNTVKLLLQQNVDVYAVDDRGWTAENYASFKTLRINRQLICDYKKERRCKESSENSNLVDECSKKDPASSLSCNPGIDGSRSISQDKNFTVDPKEEPTKPAIGKKENVQMSALGLGEEEDVKSPGDSEVHTVPDQSPQSKCFNRNLLRPVDSSVPELRPGTYADHSLFTAVLVQQVEELHLSMKSEKEQVRLDGSEKNHRHVCENLLLNF
ncbi:uncharacterized protein LOC109439559 isoform X3 [Rhinolophus sinicus]|uniref:uncharacterized protein LOC109439559 isoform X3 n=1 Tax=Rhinolophus sinicus TaxID=89399 RepID=UPI003D7B5064